MQPPPSGEMRPGPTPIVPKVESSPTTVPTVKGGSLNLGFEVRCKRTPVDLAVYCTMFDIDFLLIQETHNPGAPECYKFV